MLVLARYLCIIISVNISERGQDMEADYKETIEGVIEFLKDIGEDPNDYTSKQLQHMIEEGF